MAEACGEVLKMIGRSPEFAMRGEHVVTFGPYRFCPTEGLWRDGSPVPMPPRAIGVLTTLLATPGSIVSKRQLMDAVWPGTFVTESSLLEAIGLVRDALGDDRRNPTFIQTVHRRGYRFIGTIEQSNLEPSRSELSELPEPAELAAAPFFSGPQWRPIVLACVTYAITTVCVAIVFAVFGQRPMERPIDVASTAPTATRLAVSHTWPSWTPEGIEIAFAFSKAGPFHTAGAWDRLPTSVSPDGQLMVFAEAHPMSGTDIWLLDLRTRTRRVLIRTWSDETFARFSPDGRSIAYMSNVSGRWEVYVQSLTSTAVVRVSSGGGLWPSWSTDGRTLYFNSGDATMAAAIATMPTLVAAAPAVAQHDRGRARAHADLRVVLDWFSELARIRPS
jgi:DNA-binding winged helix-turn-helix (wHTH) protein